MGDSAAVREARLEYLRERMRRVREDLHAVPSRMDRLRARARELGSSLDYGNTVAWPAQKKAFSSQISTATITTTRMI